MTQVLISATVLAAALTMAPTGAAFAQQTTSTDTAADRVVTIVKVPRPWYAADFLIHRGFRKAIPQYSAIDGLEHKMFTLAEDGRFGGIYLWRTRAQAESWFGPAWQQRVRASYGEPSIDWYSVQRVMEGPARAGLAADHAEAVATLVDAQAAATVSDSAPGLVRRYELRDPQGRRTDILLWQDLAQAVAHVGDRLSVQRATIDFVSVRFPRTASSLCAGQSGKCPVEYFDAPVLLWPAKMGQ